MRTCLFSNKILIYLSTRYLTYGLQFFLSLIIAARLGPYYLGIYGMVQLILSYFAQINFGIPHSLNIYLVHNKNNKNIQNEYSLNSFVLFSYINVFIVLGTGIFVLFGCNLPGPYNIGKYLPFIIGIAILTYYNSLLSMIIRFRNQVNTLSLITTIPVIVNLIIVCFFTGDNLVLALTIVNLFVCIFTFIIAYIKGAIPKFCLGSVKISTQKNLIHKGLYLFLYNSCFYFILIAVRTIISGNYTVEEFGYFTFSFTIANAVMLLLDSLNSIIFPKIIDLLSSTDGTQKAVILDKLRVGYITTSHLLIYLAMMCFPLLVLLFPKYEPALNSMNLIALSILMNTNSYGYNTLLIAQNKESLASRNSLIALMVTLLVSMILVRWIHVRYSFVILSSLIAYLFFSILTTFEANKIIRNEVREQSILNLYFPLRLLIPYISALFISIFEFEYLIFIPFLVFLMLNYKDLRHLKQIGLKLLHNPNIFDI